VSGEPRRAGVLAAGATLLCGVVLGIGPVSVGRIVAGYVLLLAAIAIVSLIRMLGADSEHAPISPFEYALSRTPERPSRPAELVRIERELTLGTSSAGHLHSRLLPLLREAAVARLGHSFTRERVGDDVWELLRPDRPEPDDRSGPGVSLRRIRGVVSTLERL
jgi:hypothetical protein